MVVFKDTRGRRSTSQKIRDWVHMFKGASWAGEAARSVTDAVGTTALFGMLAYAGRPKIIVAVSPVRTGPYGYDGVILENLERTEQQFIVPTLLGRPVTRINVVHPDVGLAEGIGALAFLMALPGGDITGFIEKGIGIGMYHALLNGYKIKVPGITSTTLEQLELADWQLWILGLAGAISPFLATLPPVSDPAYIKFSGLMGGLVWTPTEIRNRLQTEIDTGKLAWPLKLQALPNKRVYGYAFDGAVLPIYTQRWLHDLGHAGLITLLFRRGLGQKLLE